MTSTRNRTAAEAAPVVRVLVDVPLPHLDRPFDYLVPTELDADARRGSRVRVRFAGRLVDAYVLERVERSEHGGRLAYIERVVGTEPVLTDETARLFRAVADRYGGSFVDVARLGIPPRHARAEAEVAGPSHPMPQRPDPAPWTRYRAGPAFLAAVTDSRPARAVWSALPGEDWPARLAEAVATALAAGRGAVVVVPDARDLARLDAALLATVGAGSHVALSAELGPAERYRRWLAARRGTVRGVIGTRAAALTPVENLGLLAIWDDGDDLHTEPRAPYPHVRDVLALRSSLTGAALLIGGFARTAEAAQLVQTGWAQEIVATRETVRASSPRIEATGDDFEQQRDPGATGRLPSLALRVAREALTAGRPVLVQVPRRGYVPALACVRDRVPARCPSCKGPLAASSGHAIPTCQWCGRPAGDWRCPICGERRMRAVVVGSARTAEELGRAFPGVPVRSSSGETVLSTVPDKAAVIVATPSAEPIADGGYGAVLLLDAWALLGRPDLRAAEEALRRWMNAAALARADGRVVIGADLAIPAVSALIRWDSGWFADRELADRAELGFPPTTRMASVTGTAHSVSELMEAADLPAQHDILGPLPVDDDTTRLLIRVPRRDGTALAVALKQAAAQRSARKASDPLKIVLDPANLG